MGWTIKTDSVIYALRCTVNGKVYIGRTQNLERRMREHFLELKKGYRERTGDGLLQKDFNQYGVDAFEVYVLEENVPPSKAQEREYAWMLEYRATDPKFGYNKIGSKQREGFVNLKKGLPPKITNK